MKKYNLDPMLWSWACHLIGESLNGHLKERRCKNDIPDEVQEGIKKVMEMAFYSGYDASNRDMRDIHTELTDIMFEHTLDFPQWPYVEKN